VNIEIIILPTYRNGQYSGQKGTIKEVNGDVVRVETEGKETINVPGDQIEPSAPNKKDTLKIIRGEFKGSTGSLIAVYGQDGIVKLDSNGDIKILPMTSIVKVAS